MSRADMLAGQDMSEKLFGTLPDGSRVTEFEVRHPGIALRAISYGGIITALEVPDAEGRMADVVLGMPALTDYTTNNPWFGAITGRIAGRLSGGRLPDGEKVRQLEINDPPNHLHGGSCALDKQNWSGKAGEEGGVRYIEFCHTSPDGDSGYPGNVSICVRYSLVLPGTLRIDYRATTDMPTPLSLTNHSYFNLAGENAGTIENHTLQIFSESIVPADQNGTLSGRVVSVADKPEDFRTARKLADAIPNLSRQHGSNYMIPQKAAGCLAAVARLTEPTTHRTMDVFSTEPCLQFYTGRFLDKAPFPRKSGGIYPPFAGLCLECQGYPDAPNAPWIGNITLQPGDTYRQRTEYRFGVA
jgi:aldose 1-epimerase